MGYGCALKALLKRSGNPAVGTEGPLSPFYLADSCALPIEPNTDVLGFKRRSVFLWQFKAIDDIASARKQDILSLFYRLENNKLCGTGSI
jgi:hypothetical protein